jgi:hypothetical protein
MPTYKELFKIKLFQKQLFRLLKTLADMCQIKINIYFGGVRIIKKK